MAWGRTEAAEYLIEHHGDLLADAGLDATDEVGGLKEPIDDALLKMSALVSELDSTRIANVARFRDELREALEARTPSETVQVSPQGSHSSPPSH